MNNASVAVLLAMAALCGGCGKKGDPLPPLVRVPVAPGDLVAERRASTTELRFTVPASNTDGTRPANIQRVDVYALTGSGTVSDDELLKIGTRIASVAVKAPLDPDDVIGPDDPNEDLQPPQGSGLDQGISTMVKEDLPAVAASASTNADIPTRHYLAIGISTRGRRGLFSRRVTVPLVAAPAAPSAPALTYDATTLILTWSPVSAAAAGAGTGLGYNVYEVSKSATSEPAETRLTADPISEPRFVDRRIEWGVERCFTVRTTEGYPEGLRVESSATPTVCVTPADKFAPAPPAGLTPVASEATVNLTWDANAEQDLAGYLVLRGAAPGELLVPLTAAPIQETSFKDTVQSGVRFVYAVQSVDKAGNVSAPSARVEAVAP